MSIASPPRALTTVGVVTHPRRNCDEVFTAIVGWVRARGARLIALPEEAPAGVSHADQVPGEGFASTADLVDPSVGHLNFVVDGDVDFTDLAQFRLCLGTVLP